jgi:SulP family sulfate permease
MLVPKLATTLKGYNRQQLLSDVTAGVIVGIVAIPLAIAFAIASGVTPQQGLYTAIVAGFIISALGGSRVQIGGPTGAFVVIVYGIIQKYGIDGLTVATVMAGVILVVLGVARLGTAIKFIPHSVTIGFTGAIAIIIAIQQIDTALGLKTGPLPAQVFERLAEYGKHLDTTNAYAVAITAATLAILILWPKISTRLPAPFVALVAMTAVARLFHLPVVTIGDRFGVIHAGLPSPALPHVTFSMLRELVAPAMTIAALGAIESLLSAVVSDGMIGSRHRSSMELVAQGVANIVTPLFGGIPATGAIARTATNVKAGGRTPIAGMTHAVVLLLITLFFGKLAGLIPLATLAGILMLVAYRMSEWRVFVAELHGPRSDAAVLLTTFFLTLLIDLTVGIGVGMVLEDADQISTRDVPPGIEVYEVDGPFFFGAAEKFKDVLAEVFRKPKVLIIRLRHVPAIDSTGLNVLRDLIRRTRHDRTLVLISELQSQPLLAMRRSGLLDEIGQDNVVGTIDLALAIGQQYLIGRPQTPVSAPVV